MNNLDLNVIQVIFVHVIDTWLDEYYAISKYIIIIFHENDKWNEP